MADEVRRICESAGLTVTRGARRPAGHPPGDRRRRSGGRRRLKPVRLGPRWTRSASSAAGPSRARCASPGPRTPPCPTLCAALLTDQPVVLTQRPRGAGHPHHGPGAGRPGRRGGVPRRGHGRGPGRQPDLGRGALRPGQDHAGLGAGAGPLLAREGRARVSLPGGCAIGARPINLHLDGPREDGRHDRRRARLRRGRARERLRGAEIYFDTVTVTGTENIMMAACLAEGETVFSNAACEPEIEDLAELLVKPWARGSAARATSDDPDRGRRAPRTAPSTP